MTKPYHYIATILFAVFTIIAAPAHADETGKALIQGLFGAVLQQVEQEMGKDTAPAPTSPQNTAQPQSNTSPLSMQSQNCGGPFGSRYKQPDLPLCVHRCCGGLGLAKGIQKSLYTTGYYKGAIDGDFGPSTQAAINAWENDNDVVRDGLISYRESQILDKLAMDAHYKPTPNEGAAAPSPTTIPDELHGVHWEEWSRRRSCEWLPCNIVCGIAVQFKKAENSEYIRKTMSNRTALEKEHYRTWDSCEQAVKNIADAREAARIAEEERQAPKRALVEQAGNMILKEEQRLEQEGKHIQYHSPTGAIKTAIEGDPSALAEGDYYVSGRQVKDYYCSMTNPPEEYQKEGACGLPHGKSFTELYFMLGGTDHASNYKIAQTLDDYVLYQHQTLDLPPILIERESERLYLKGQSLDLASVVFEYIGPTSYESVTGAAVQALVFKGIRNEAFEEAQSLVDKAARMPD